MSRSIRRTRATGALLLTLPLTLTGCDPGPIGPAELLLELPRPLAVAEEKIIASSNDFAFDLLETISASAAGNVFVSPLSVSMALAMTMNGAGGATYHEMRETLGLAQLHEAEINDAYRDLTDLLVELDPEVKLSVANSVWYRSGFPFEQSFFSRIEEPFSARVAGLDFASSAAVPAINSWVEDATGGRIKSIVDRLDPSEVMYLINALHFDASWRSRFDPSATRDEQFTRSDGSTTPVRMMSAFGSYRHAYLPGFAALDLPYGNGAFSMLVLLPREGLTTRNILDNLNAQRFSEIETSLVERELQVGLPRFELEWEGSLVETLSALGMRLAFSDLADFTRMSAGGGLYLSEVKHKTYVSVDEEGTEAAAVTGVGVGVVSAPPSFVVDRPFVFFIREKLSGTILFAGRIESPPFE